MKLKNIILFISLLLAFASCSDDTSPTLVMPAPATFAELSATDIEIKDNNWNEIVLIANWEAEESQQGIITKFALQLDIAGNDFQKPYILVQTNEKSASILGSELNDFLTKNFKQEVSTLAEYEIRVVSVVIGGPGIILVKPETASTSQTLFVTTSPLRELPMLYVPGEHNGWAHTSFITAPKYGEPFEGYMYITGGFKFSTQPNWNGTNYGDGGTGALSTDGGAGNLSLAGGLYLLHADIEALKWTSTAVAWGIIGSATPGEWDSDTPMTYDPATKMMVTTLSLKAGELKFRRDGAWAVNLGDNGVEGMLQENGGNLTFSGTAGLYKITLDLFSGANQYSYTITPVQ